MDKIRGFTLLEVMIALFIFTIVSLIMTNALHHILSVQARVEKNAALLAEMQRSFLFFSHDLEQAIDRPISDPDGNTVGSFIGKRQSIIFTHAGFDNRFGAAQSSQLQRVEFRIDKDSFVKDSFPVLDPLPETSPHTRILLHPIKDISFRYLDQNKEFHSFWPPPYNRKKSSKLPQAVELSITFQINLDKSANTKDTKVTQLYLLPQSEGAHESP